MSAGDANFILNEEVSFKSLSCTDSTVSPIGNKVSDSFLIAPYLSFSPSLLPISKLAVIFSYIGNELSSSAIIAS